MKLSLSHCRTRDSISEVMIGVGLEFVVCHSG